MNAGRIDICEFVAFTATNPAKMYGLSPRKGSIAIGADADLAIWDAKREVTITNALLHHDVDYTPYEGMRVLGWPVTTVSRGELVWADGQFAARKVAASFFAAVLLNAIPARQGQEAWSIVRYDPLPRGAIRCGSSPSMPAHRGALAHLPVSC